MKVGRALAWVLPAVLLVPLLWAAAAPGEGARLREEVTAQVLPLHGHQSKVALGDSIVHLTQAGVIDRAKMEALHAAGGTDPRDLRQLLNQPSQRPIRISAENARLYVNLLWPVGLANRMAANSASPLNGPTLPRYASTGGWTLGREANGAAYFNTYPLVRLTPEAEALVTQVAQHTFRPCCNNSTFFQDCNHGSALLGLLALGASQGLGEADLYREALAFNTFWFPDQYTQIAMYFKVVEGVDWRDVDARTALSATFSSGGGMQANVTRALQTRGLLPAQQGTDCSA